ncbi:MAG: sugar transferase [Spirochaetes bacterium]|nr:sugar transferase [Spirochaetota bacterium]
MRKKIRYRQFFLLFVDVILMYASLIISLMLRRGDFPPSSVLQVHLYHFSIIFVVWIIIFYTLGFYRLDLNFCDWNYAKLLATGLMVAGLSSILYFYGPLGVLIAPKTVQFLLLTVFGILLWTWRFLYGKIYRAKRKQEAGVGFIGYSKEVRDIIRKLDQQTPIGYDIRFVFSEDFDPKADIGSIPFLHECGQLRETIRNSSVDFIVLPGKQSLNPEISRELYNLLDMGLKFISLTDFYEAIFRRVPIRAISEMWFLENIDLKHRSNYEFFKEAGDRILSSLLFLICLPFFPLIALIIKLESPGPVFFTQERIGRFGVPYMIIKFRTMRVQDNDFSPTKKNDSRITKFGSFLRSSRIDELPQLINIIKGEMCIIGPRPERPELARELARAIPYYQQRHLVKPGITGWDQVSGEYHSPSIEDTQKKLQFDLYYLKNLSFSLDFSIIFKTVMVVFRREGR